tara:strand:+ start:57 stop:1058 length:1002 start_codon:yes stop_codon:yes gene_type:complete
MKRLFLLLIFFRFTLFSCELDTYFIFGTKPENGGALFKGADSISLGVIRNEIFEAISDEVDVISIPFYESGIAVGAGSVNASNLKNLQLWIRVNKQSNYWFLTYINWPSLDCPSIENPSLEKDFTISDDVQPSSILFSPIGNSAVITQNDGIDDKGLSFTFTSSNSDSDSDGLLDSVETNTGVFISSEDSGTDPFDSDTDNDGINDGDEVNKHNSNPLTSDSDGDGVNDYTEIYLNELNFDVSEDSSLLLDIIERAGFVRASESNSDTGLSLDEVIDLRPGSTMIEVSGNQATVQLQMEESSDLQTWQDKGDPATMTIPADTDTKFFRFKMAE